VISRPFSKASVAGLAYFGIIFPIAFALGTLRVLVLIPRLGELVALFVELPILLIISWVVCRRLIERIDVPPTLSERFVMGATAFAVLMLAEICGATFGFGRSLSEHFEQYWSLSGMLGLAGQIVFALIPIIQSASSVPRSAM
jgi:voltage-gated potassium channel Kch